jgi:hypothetical protein
MMPLMDCCQALPIFSSEIHPQFYPDYRMDNPIQDGVRNRRVRHEAVPEVYRVLTYEDGRHLAVPFLDEFEEVLFLGLRHGTQAKVIYDQCLWSPQCCNHSKEMPFVA